MTYEPIIIDPIKGVVDGQHRLLGVVQSGVPCEFLIVRGKATCDAIAAMDTGVARSVATILHSSGIKNANNIASVAKGYYHYLNGVVPWNSMAASRKVSNKSINDICSDNPHIHEIVRLAIRTRFKETGIVRAAGVIAMIAHDDSPEHAIEFLDQYEHADTIAHPNHPLRQLYTRMLKARAVSTSQMKPHIKSALVAKAYNAFVTGQDVGVLKYSPSESVEIVSASHYACV